jgi:phosphinothricin acetyltransferase
VIGVHTKVISMAALIRFAEPADAAGILAIYAPFCESSCVTFEIVAPTLAQMRQRISDITLEYPWIMAEIDGRVAGYVYGSRYRERAAYQWAVNVAVYVDPNHHRHGLARLLYETLFDILRDQGFYKALAGISLPNPPSVGLHERMGFRAPAVIPGVGFKLGRWLDVGWWQLDLQPRKPEPADPTPFRLMRENPILATAMAEGQRKLDAQNRAAK